jgi:hypothetical protein
MDEVLPHDKLFFQEFIEDFMRRDDHVHESFTFRTGNNTEITENSLRKIPFNLYNVFQRAFIPQPSHKRSYEQLIKEEIITDINSSFVDEKVEKIAELSFKDLPTELYALFNQGNVKMLNSLIERHFDPHCVIRLKKPGLDYNDIGPGFVLKKYNALLNAHPDGVVTIHKSSMRHENGNYIVHCNLRFRGTCLFDSHMKNLCRESIGKETDWSLTNFLDKSKHSTEYLDYYTELEKVMLQRNEVPMMFVKVSVVFIFDEHTHKVKMYSAHSRLSSFRPVDPKAMI